MIIKRVKDDWEMTQQKWQINTIAANKLLEEY